jgi:hypothetical protein
MLVHDHRRASGRVRDVGFNASSVLRVPVVCLNCELWGSYKAYGFLPVVVS